MFTQSKDEQVLSRQLRQKNLQLKANLVAQTSEAPAIISLSGALATRTITIDVKEPVESCQQVQIVDRATGQSVAISAAPVISGNTIAVTLDATGLSDVCISADYRN
jgi:hypothetical protein